MKTHLPPHYLALTYRDIMNPKYNVDRQQSLANRPETISPDKLVSFLPVYSNRKVTISLKTYGGNKTDQKLQPLANMSAEGRNVSFPAFTTGCVDAPGVCAAK